jgi:hypothetical protein
MTVVVNLGGEGEVAGAVNVNAFIRPQMFDDQFTSRVPADLVVHRSAHDTGLPSDSADEVIANHFPIQHDELVIDLDGTRVNVTELAGEIVRILRPGGRLHFQGSSCHSLGAAQLNLARVFREAGLDVLAVHRNGYIDARKP